MATKYRSTIFTKMDFDTSHEFHGGSLQIQKKTLGEEHADAAVTLSDMGDFYEKRGNLGQRKSQ